jgi:hypothetical protein
VGLRTTENTLKPQLWIVFSVYMLVAFVIRQVALEVSHNLFLARVRPSHSKKMPIVQALDDIDYQDDLQASAKPLILFDF